MTEKPEITLTVRLPRDLSSRLDSAASDFDLTRGEIVRRALESHLDQLGRIAMSPQRTSTPAQLTQ